MIAGPRFLSVGSIIRSLLFLSWCIVSFCCGVRLENVGVIFLLCATASVMACSKSSSCASVLEEAGGGFQFLNFT